MNINFAITDEAGNILSTLSASGDLSQTMAEIAQSLPPGQIIREVAPGEIPNSVTRVWNPLTHAFVPRPVPTDDEVLRAQSLSVMATLSPTAAAGKPALLQFMKLAIADAQAFDWFNTKAQADGALTAPQKTAVAALNTQLYQRARAAVAAWYSAL